MDEIRANLSVAGLSGLESEIYLKLLNTGQTRVSELASATGIGRTQLYPLIKNMIRKGYVREIPSKPVKFKAVEPSELIGLLKSWNQKRMDVLKELQPRLSKIKMMPSDSVTEVSMVDERSKIFSKILDLFKKSQKSVVAKDRADIGFMANSKKLRKILEGKPKEFEGKFYIYGEENEQLIKKVRESEKMKFSLIRGELPYSLFVFDKKNSLIVFYNREKNKYEKCVSIENAAFANSMAD